MLRDLDLAYFKLLDVLTQMETYRNRMEEYTELLFGSGGSSRAVPASLTIFSFTWRTPMVSPAFLCVYL